MHIALGYYFFPATTGYHLERALRALGHTVSYVGLPAMDRPGYGQALPLPQVLSSLATPPDLFWWIDAGGPYFPSGIEDLPIPSVGYLIDVHLGAWRKTATGFFDAVFVAQKDYLPAFRQAAGHDQVYWLPLAAANDYHRRLDLPLLYDVGFVGNQMAAHHRSARTRRLKLLASRYHTNDFLQYYPPETVSQVYSQSRVVFNTSLAGDVNMRVFEGTACGALLLTDGVANGLDELFDIGRELVTYNDDADLLAKLDYYLAEAHQAERAAIGAAGQARTQSEHSYERRAAQALSIMGAPGFQRAAPMRSAAAGERWRARKEIYTHLHMLEAVMDGARAESRNPLRRAWAVLPVLARRLMR